MSTQPDKSSETNVNAGQDVNIGGNIVGRDYVHQTISHTTQGRDPTLLIIIGVVGIVALTIVALVALSQAGNDSIGKETGTVVQTADIPIVLPPFQLASGTLVALQGENEQYLCAQGCGGDKVSALCSDIRQWETFTWNDLPNDRVALQAYDGQYMCVSDSDYVAAKCDANSPKRPFDLINLGNNHIALRSTNGQYACLQDRELMVSCSTPRDKAVFRLVVIEIVSIRTDNGSYICAQDDGKVNLLTECATTDSIFRLMRLGNNEIALKAHGQLYDGQYVCKLSDSGEKVTLCNHLGIGPEQEFKLIDLGTKGVALQAPNNNYLCVSAVDGKELAASCPNPQETFTLLYR